MIVVYGPYPSTHQVRDGWRRRIAALDRILDGRERHYVFPGNPLWAGDPRDYRVVTERVAPGATFTWLDLRFSTHHRFLGDLIARAEFVYAHTSHSVQHLLPFYGTGKIITDLHGIAPEEEVLQGKPGRGAFFAGLEETMVRHSAMLVTVTGAMVDHLRRKYPGLDTPVLLLPIVEDVAAAAPVTRPARERLRIVYSGGLQRWQNVDAMLDVVRACRERFEFEFYTDQPDRLRAMADACGVAGNVRVTTAEPAELPAIYAAADLGFVLRDDSAVNRVSCPTKLSEYMACGVVPVVDLFEIGDFARLGYQAVRVGDLLAGRLPSAAELTAMRQQNRTVFERIQQQFAAGRTQLQRPLVVTPRTVPAPSLLLTTLERTAFYPRSGARLWLERDDGSHEIDCGDICGADCRLDYELPGTGTLRSVRFCPGDAPFVTTPVVAEVIGARGGTARVEWTDGVDPDRFGNWRFGARGAALGARGLQVADAARLRLRFEYLLVGPEAFVADIAPQRARLLSLSRLAKVPGARPMWALLQRLRNRLRR